MKNAPGQPLGAAPTNRDRRLRTAVLAATIVVVILIAGYLVATDPQYHSVRLLNAACSTIADSAVYAPGADTLVVAGADGMLSLLDPYCLFLPPVRRDILREETEGLYYGIGIEMVIYGGVVTVVSPIAGSPAYRAGVRAGDRIVRIDGKPATGITTGEAMRRLRGPRGTRVSVTVERPGVAYPLTFELARDEIVVRPVAFAGLTAEGIGYVRLVRFSPTAAEMLDSVLQQFLSQGSRGWVLDLRGNPGGFLDQAIDVAGCFLPQGALVCETRGRNRFANSSLFTSDEPVSTTIPLVVLIDGGSASASEIVAAAITDHHRGVIVGRRSFGKGLVQSQGVLNGEYGLQLTTARYYTPGGYTFSHTWPGEDTVAQSQQDVRQGGLLPDFEVTGEGPFAAEAEVMRRGMYLNFVAMIGDSTTGVSFDSLWSGFLHSLDAAETRFATPVALMIAEAESVAASSPLAAEWKTAFNRLTVPVTAEREAELARAMPRLKMRLTESLMLYGGERGRRFLPTYLALDDDTRTAVEILSDPRRYQSLLGSSNKQPAVALGH